MNYLKLFEAWSSKINTKEFDNVLTDLIELIKGDDKLMMRIKKGLVSDIYGIKDKELSKIKEELWERNKDYFKNKTEFNSFISKVHTKIKDFNVTKVKQLLKSLRSHTTGKRA